MSDNIITEKDWKLFRKMLPDWQERYMENLINDYEAVEFVREINVRSHYLQEGESAAIRRRASFFIRSIS